MRHALIYPLDCKGNYIFSFIRQVTHSLTHCCAWPARAVATSTTSDPGPIITSSRLCTHDPLPPVVSRSSLADQVHASSRGQGICPARGWHSAGGYCGLTSLVVGVTFLDSTLFAANLDLTSVAANLFTYLLWFIYRFSFAFWSILGVDPSRIFRSHVCVWLDCLVFE